MVSARRFQGAATRAPRGTRLALVASLLGAPGLAAQDLSVTMSVDDPTLMPGAAVEFEIVVKNTGVSTAKEVRVEDRLPDGLVIPAGRAPFSDVGSYDPETGVWELGSLPGGGAGTLVIPAQVVADPLPARLFNRADVESATLDPDPTNNVAVVSLRQSVASRNVELEFLIQSIAISPCDKQNVTLRIEIENKGPESARDLTITLEPGPERPPGLEFISAVCAGEQQCPIAELAAGASTVFLAESSNGIKNKNPREFEVTVSASSPYFEGEKQSSTRRFTKAPFGNCPGLLGSGEGVGGGGGGGCFIATAAYGTSMHPDVAELRRFRDEVLVPHAAGRWLVNVYYRVSPPVARYIASRPALRAAARAGLRPIVTVIRHPPAAGLLLLCLGLTLAILVRARRQRTS